LNNDGSYEKIILSKDDEKFSAQNYYFNEIINEAQ
jgi:hypothetical protein